MVCRLVLLCCLIASCASVPARPVAWTEAAHAVVLLENQRGQHGSAFPFAARRLMDGTWRVRFLTAAHMMPYGPFHVEGGRVLSLTQVPGRDLAVVVVVMAELPPLIRLRDHVPALGDRVFAAGYPVNRDVLRVSEGLASAVRGYCSLPISFGSSGGPCLLEDGSAIGVMVEIDTAGPSGVWNNSKYEPLDGGVLKWLKSPPSLP